MRFPLFFLFIFSLVYLPAQSFRPYAPNQGPTAELLGIGGGLTLFSSYLGRKVKPLTLEEINKLDPSVVWGIDRYSLRHYSPPTAKLTDKVLLAAFVSPFFHLFGKQGRDNAGDIGLVVFEGALLNAALVNLSKVTAKRTRPYAYQPEVPIELKRKKATRYSFFSGHAATTAFFAFSSAKLYNDLYPDSNAKPYVWAAASLLPTFVAYGRMKAGKHFFTDVLTGLVIGTSIALVVPELNKP